MVSIAIVNDTILENEEVFVVSTSVASGQQRVDISSQNATVSITSDDDGVNMNEEHKIFNWCFVFLALAL